LAKFKVISTWANRLNLQDVGQAALHFLANNCNRYVPRQSQGQLGKGTLNFRVFVADVWDKIWQPRIIF